MDDSRIVELYWLRDQRAIEETQAKYGTYCNSIARQILDSREDAEEVVSDTYIAAWNAIPPQRPAILRTFLGKITRRLALKRMRSRNTQKRGTSTCAIALEELEECVPSGFRIDERLEAEELTELIDRFLAGLREEERNMFLCRYWYFDSVGDIAERFACTRSKVKMTLLRLRKKLLAQLQKEDYLV